MTRSGIKQGLAVSAVAALATVGLPAAAHAAASTDVSSITLSPSKTSVSTGEFTTYTITAKKADGTAATGDIHIVVSEAVPSTTPATVPTGDKLTFGGDDAAAATHNGIDEASDVADLNAPSGWQQAKDVTLTNGSATLTIASDQVGTVKVAASSTAVSGAVANSSFTVGGGQTGNNAVKNVVLGASSISAYAGEPAGTTVSLTDGSGFGVSGADFSYQIDGTGTVYTGTITGNGNYKTTVSLPALPVGAHTVKFWVNQTSGTTNTPAADAGEPTSTLSVTVDDATKANSVSSTYSKLEGVGGIKDGGNLNAFPSYQGATVGAKVTLHDGSDKPVAGVKVRFDVYAGAAVPSQFQISLYGTTDANGVVSVSAPITADQAKKLAGSAIVVDAHVSESNVAGQGVGPAFSGPVAEFENPTNTTKLVGSAGNTVDATKGSTASITLSVTDQFGKPAVGHVLQASGGQVVPATDHLPATNAQGQTTFSYTDVNKVNTTDTLTFTDLGDGTATANPAAPATVKVTWVNSLTAASITANGAFPADNTAAPATVAAAAGDAYSVLVKNADGTALANHAVTFTVDTGFITDTVSGKGTAKSVTVKTDNNGYATAYAGSEQVGTQIVTITSDAAPALKGNKRAYKAGAFYHLTATPPANITTGSSGKLTLSSSDEFGNPVALAGVNVTQSGAGSLPGGLSTQKIDIPSSGVITVTIDGGATPGTGTLVADAGAAVTPDNASPATVSAYSGPQTVTYNVVAPPVVKPPTTQPPTTQPPAGPTAAQKKLAHDQAKLAKAKKALKHAHGAHKKALKKQIARLKKAIRADKKAIAAGK